jgi:hypothetical protein
MRPPISVPLVLLALALSPLLHATEVDNFSDREALSRDAMPVLDGKVNKILERAALVANRESPERCNRVMLRQEIVRWTGPDPVSLLELWATLSDDVQRTPIGFADSIYADASFRDSPAMKVFGIGRTFLLAGHVVGTDKLGHFFMQGLGYFKRVDLDGAALDEVLRNEHGEDGIWGLKATGVKSYGDMSANYSGYRFWSELYEGQHPYMRCEDGHRWVKARKFTWADYVTDAWDEAINCSEMLPGLKKSVDLRLSRLGLRCPVDPARCQALGKLDKAEFYVSPVCLGLASAPSPARVARQ